MEIIPTFFKTFALTDTETRSMREKVCKNCDHLDMLDRCEICHCFMFLKNKFEEAKCPLGKW